jgi:hypothetical protein
MASDAKPQKPEIKMTRTVKSDPQNFRFVPRDASPSPNAAGLILAGLVATASVVALLAAPPAVAQTVDLDAQHTPEMHVIFASDLSAVSAATYAIDLDAQHNVGSAMILHSEEEAAAIDTLRVQASLTCPTGSSPCSKIARPL